MTTHEFDPNEPKSNASFTFGDLMDRIVRLEDRVSTLEGNIDNLESIVSTVRDLKGWDE
jgi:hypothetical protein